MPLQSQTWSNLRQLLSELPKRRVRLLILVLLASLVHVSQECVGATFCG